MMQRGRKRKKGEDEFVIRTEKEQTTNWQKGRGKARYIKYHGSCGNLVAR